ncbi:MAG: thiamine pyrophosphate-dependent enzyme [Terracidiphilus sp.]
MKKNSHVTAPDDDTFSLISNQKLLALYAAMVECREKASSAMAQMRGRPARRASRLVPIAGCEAAVVGAAIDLGSGDTIATELWPEGFLSAVNRIAFITARVRLDGHRIPPSGGHRSISMVFSNRKKAGQALWRKMLERAMADSLAVLFVCLTDERAAPLADSLADLPAQERHYLLPSITVDGSDVVAVYRVASEAITHARKGNGPALIECVIAPSRDPIEHMAQYLRRKGLLEAPPASQVGA